MEGEITSLQKLWKHSKARESRTSKAKFESGISNTHKELTLLWDKMRAMILEGSTVKDTFKESDIKAKMHSITPMISKLLFILIETERTETLNDELARLIIYSLHYYFDEALHVTGIILGNKIIKAELQEQLNKIFKMFNDIFVVILKYKTVLILENKQVVSIIDNIMNFVQKNITESILGSIEADAIKRECIASLVYHAFKLLIVISPESFKKYQRILDKFKIAFTLIVKSEVFNKIANEPHAFGNKHWEYNNKLILKCCGVKWLSVFIQDKKIKEGEIILKYFLIYLFYQIIKCFHISLNEDLQNIFVEMIYQNKAILFDLILKQGSPFMISLLLNENMYFIKASIISLCYLPSSLSSIQRQSKYQAMQAFFRDSLSLLINFAMYVQNDTCSITKPQDFIAVLFKSLSLFKRYKKSKKTMGNILCLLVEEISLMRITSLNRLWVYKIYWIELLLSFDNLLLNSNKYKVELGNIIKESVPEADYEILKKRTHELALTAYVRILQNEPVESLKELINSVNMEWARDYLYLILYLLCCSLPDTSRCKKTFTLEDFDEFLLDEGRAWSVLGVINVSHEMDIALSNGIFRPLYAFYNKTLNYYINFINNEPRKGSNSPTSSQHNVWEDKSYEIKQVLNFIESFVVIVHYITPVSKQFILEVGVCKKIYDEAFKSSIGRNYLLRLLDVICIKLREPPIDRNAIENFVDLHIHIINSLTFKLNFDEEKTFLLHLMNNLELLIIDEVILLIIK